MLTSAITAGCPTTQVNGDKGSTALPGNYVFPSKLPDQEEVEHVSISIL
jgi:hypothetical protein